MHDELDIPYGTLRLKRGGGEGGHNGLRDTTKALGTKDYVRVRVGVGRPPGRMDPADFVLRDFSGTERKELPILLVEAADAVELVVLQGLDRGAAAGPRAPLRPRLLRTHASRPGLLRQVRPGRVVAPGSPP